MKEAAIDIIEDDLVSFHPSILNILLQDKTTHKNIIWATKDYVSFGKFYSPYYEIVPEQITGSNKEIIRPRVCKPSENQNTRTKDSAEVFTPAWICNIQNNIVDEEWFGKKNVFNTETDKGWKNNPGKIEFPQNKTWKNYIDLKRLEISCGEAPYLVSRYDAAVGAQIPVNNRIGLLDRKLRILNENASSDEEWIKWCIRAFQSIYGYELQGDNLLLARENLLLTFFDYYKYKFFNNPDIKLVKNIANIIAWNIWQMDGLTYMVPYPKDRKHQIQCDLFEDVEKKTIDYYCKVFDWRSNNSLKFYKLISGS